jgi:cation diffusion facilitator CzcD-associated flavoprotein CzcO
MTTRQTGLTAPGPAAAGHAGVLVVGAGTSGIDTGYRLKTRLAGTTFLILDAREDRRHLGSVPVPGCALRLGRVPAHEHLPGR